MRLPKYCRHKASGLGYARVRGHCVYFGPHDDPESKRGYEQAMARLLAAGDAPTAPAPRTTTVRQGVAGYLDAMRGEWGDGERGDRHMVRLHHALDVVTDLFPGMVLAKFGVPQLEAVRKEMVRRDWSRKHINEQVNVIRRCWRWLTSRDYVPTGVLERMAALEHLKAGRSPAREGKRREPPTAEVLARVLSRLDRTNPLIGVMLRVQLAGGMRTGELLALSADQIDASGQVWIYRPRQHKNLHRGKGRVIVIPPEATELLKPLVSFTGGKLAPTSAPIFDPHRAALMRPRTTAHPPGWRARGGPDKLNTHYRRDSYGQALARACKAEGVEPFCAYSLRHMAVTRWVEAYGAEAARVLAGHSTGRMTAHYTHTDASKLAALLIPKQAVAG